MNDEKTFILSLHKQLNYWNFYTKFHGRVGLMHLIMTTISNDRDSHSEREKKELRVSMISH